MTKATWQPIKSQRSSTNNVISDRDDFSKSKQVIKSTWAGLKNRRQPEYIWIIETMKRMFLHSSLGSRKNRPCVLRDVKINTVQLTAAVAGS